MAGSVADVGCECPADLRRLPDAQRQVILLHDLHGLTVPEIAEKLGLSIDNVKIRLHRARARLKAALSEGCEFTRNDRGVFVCEPKGLMCTAAGKPRDDERARIPRKTVCPVSPASIRLPVPS